MAPLNPPPLPDAWPYAPRPVAAAFAWREDQELPRLGGGWRLYAPEGLDIAGEALPLGQAYGRGGIQRTGELVLRPYRRGGLVRFLNAGIYASPARFQRELQIHRALWEAGFPTVEPLGCAHRRRAWGFEGVFITRLVQAQPWPRCWERSAGMASQTASLLRALCAWGLWAPDLNATNLMVTPEGRVLALDWDRAAWEPRLGAERLLGRYHARLRRSLEKLGAPPCAREILQA